MPGPFLSSGDPEVKKRRAHPCLLPPRADILEAAIGTKLKDSALLASCTLKELTPKFKLPEPSSIA